MQLTLSRYLYFLVATLFTTAFLSSCFSATTIELCGKSFRQGSKLPLDYNQFPDHFVKELEDAEGWAKDMDEVPADQVGALPSMNKPSFIFAMSGFGSNGRKIYIRDIETLLTVKSDSQIWSYFERSLCKNMK